MYEELANSKRPTTKFYVRAGESNFMVGDYKKAQLYYDKAFANNNRDTIIFFIGRCFIIYKLKVTWWF